LATVRGHDDAVGEVAFSDDGELVATASHDRTARVWDSSTGEEVAVLPGHTHRVRTVAFTPDGSRLVTGSSDATVRVWSVSSTPLLTLGEPEGLPPGTLFGNGLVAVHPRGGQLATAEADGSVTAWDSSTGVQVDSFDVLRAPVTFVDFTPDGSFLVAGGHDGTVQVVRWPTGERLGRAHVRGAVTSVDVLSDGSGFIVNAIEPPTPGRNPPTRLYVWNLDQSGGVSERYAVDLKQLVYDWEIDPTGKLLVLNQWERMLVLDSGTGKKLSDPVYGTDEAPVGTVGFDPRGRRVLSTGWDGKMKVTAVGTWKVLLDIKAHNGRVTETAYSPDGSRFVSSGEDGTAKVWNASAGRLVVELPRQPGVITAAGYSPDGRMVWTLGKDVRFFDASSGAFLSATRLDSAPLDLEFDPATGAIVGAAEDGTAWISRCEVCVPLKELLALAEARVTRDLTTKEQAMYLHGS
jgi:WD40 repeat protein